VASNLGLDAVEIERIAAAGLLHDIGKVAIPDRILHKPGGLDAEEWDLMREHPVIGERILRAIPGMGAVARIVRHEHERFDGTGYPDGLSGEDIPIGSRIILACDTYHAMTSDRPYRARLAHGEAIAELARCAGTQFDPRVTEALIGCLYWLTREGKVAAA
jgi:HD-GYP domain-containing protein (c-di-GMP phosphodiesterase class II)